MTKLIGEILLEKQVLNHSDVEEVIKIQDGYGHINRPYFGEICVSNGICAESDVLEALSEQLNLYLYETFQETLLKGSQPTPEIALRYFPEDWWKKNSAFPLLIDSECKKIYMALTDVWNEYIYQLFEQKYGLEVIPILTSNYQYRQLVSMFEESDSELSGSIIEGDSSAAPVVKLVNECIQRAIIDQASDIHLEINKGKFFIRYRIDGVLHTVDQPDLSLHSAIISRVKLMAGLDISEKRLPQDGRIKARLSGNQVDIRVATTPTVFGENAVLRLLVNDNTAKKTGSQKTLDMFPDQLALINKITTNKNGIFLVTGPTGSGKTTSLYTLLGGLNDEQTKIITVEDPVEYQMAGLTQIQVNSDIGLDFATVLRSALRQDPDIMLIGEMRDKETAQIAIQSALTGHFVLSTLHTNDAPSSFIRLKDIGIPDYLIKSTIVGVMAQRLLRRVCPNCSKEDHMAEKVASEIGWPQIEKKWPSIVTNPTWLSAKGCEECNWTGYKGRIPVFELMDWSNDYDVPIETSAIISVARKQNMRTLKQDAVLRAANGDTTLEEVMRVIG